jgi:hypothetical protein
MRRRACSLCRGDSAFGVAAPANVRDYREKAAAGQSDVSAPAISHQERGRSSGPGRGCLITRRHKELGHVT